MAGTVLLVVHIAAGAVALVAAAIALSTAKGRLHHVRAGRVYAAAMALVCVTALPLAILGADVVLLLVAVFSFYLVFAGWRFARNASGRPQPVDWSCRGVMMALAGLGMWGHGVALFLPGAIRSGLPWRYSDSLPWPWAPPTCGITGHRPCPGRQRIARHLTNMLAGTIATVTAVVVVNVETNPAWLAWILPTLLITPLIAWWNRRVLRGTGSTPGIR